MDYISQYCGFLEKGILSNSDLIDLIELLSRLDEFFYSTVFDEIIILNKKGEFTKEGLDYLSSIDLNEESLFLKGENRQYFEFGRKDIKYDWLQFSCWKNNNFEKNIIETSKLLLSPKIEIAFLFNYWYNFYQSNDNPQSYKCINIGKYDLSEKDIKDFGMPLYFNENIQVYRIDITNNPGRERFLPGIKFIPAYKIWYGNEAQQLFGKQKILDYPNAIYIKELENGVIEMQLMDDITKCDLPYNQEKQRDIVKYFNIEKLEVDKY